MQLHSCRGTACSLHSRHSQSGQVCSAERAWAASAWQVRRGLACSTLRTAGCCCCINDAHQHADRTQTFLQGTLPCSSCHMQQPTHDCTTLQILADDCSVAEQSSAIFEALLIECPCCAAGAWAQGTLALAAALPMGAQRRASLAVLATPSWMLQMLPSRPSQAMPWPLQLQTATWTCTSRCQTGKLQAGC